MKKLMIVDDARLMRNIIKRVLASESDIEILEAGDGAEAIEMYKEHQPDVVTMDITMDHMDGVEATRAIKAYDPSANIIMISSLGQELLLKECIEAGVTDYIMKPFTEERVRSAVLKAANSVNIGVYRPI